MFDEQTIKEAWAKVSPNTEMCPVVLKDFLRQFFTSALVYHFGAEPGSRYFQWDAKVPIGPRFPTKEEADAFRKQNPDFFPCKGTDDDDLNEPLGTPSCNIGEACESCQ